MVVCSDHSLLLFNDICGSENAGQEKQKMLLSAETGHFSMIKLVLCDSAAERWAGFAHINFVL